MIFGKSGVSVLKLVFLGRIIGQAFVGFSWSGYVAFSERPTWGQGCWEQCCQ